MRQLLLLLLVGVGAVLAKPDTLVLLDNWNIRETHSVFFHTLKDQGFDLAFKMADDKSLALFAHGERLYDNLLLLCPNVIEFGGSVDVPEITRFVDEGGNMLIAADKDVNEKIRDIGTEVGVEFDEAGTAVIDHFHYDSATDDGKHTLLVAERSGLVDSEKIVGKRTGAPVLFRGIGMVADPENPLVIEVMRASSSAYSHSPDQAIVDYPHAVGRSTLLIAALQARNNARVLMTGSMELLSDELMLSAVTAPDGKKHDRSGNEELVKAFVGWTFHRRGVLRVSNVHHHLAGEKEQRYEYTVMEDVEYALDVEELQPDGKWAPLQTDDIQLELVRIDPFIRTTLKRSGKRYYARFQLPDVYGVFQFRVDYNRVGFTHVYTSTQVSIRPLRHTQYERFIVSAYPYYASAFSMMAGVVLFSIVILHYRDPEQSKVKKDQ